MALREYDNEGRLVKTIRTEADQKKENEFMGLFFGLGVLFVVFLPIFYPAYMLFRYLHLDAHVHEVFSFIISAIPVVAAFFILFKFRIARLLYFGAETIFATYFTYNEAIRTYDVVWSGSFALIAFFVGSLLTYFLTKPDDNYFRRSNDDEE